MRYKQVAMENLTRDNEEQMFPYPKRGFIPRVSKRQWDICFSMTII